MIKIKIAFIVSGFPILSETFILNQITGLLDMEHDVEIFAQSNPNEKKVHSDVKRYKLMERVHYFDIPPNKIERISKVMYLMIKNFHKSSLKILKSINIFKYGKLALSLRLLYLIIPFLDKDFDIIYCHFGPNGNLGAYLKKMGFKGKLVTMFHGYDIRLGMEKGRGIYSELFKFGDCFFAISNYNYKNLIQFGVDPQKIIFHPVGIDVNKFSYRWQSAIVERPNTIIILTVSRLVEKKGVQYGIQAISKLLKKRPQLQLEYRIIGGGRLERQLRKLVEELNLDEVVHFLGPIEQEGVIKNMQQAHIFLLPSIAEALPVVLMEAQAVGLPVVAISVGSISQVTINGKSGFLVSENDVDTLAEKLEYLVEHPERWVEMGRCGRKYVEKEYNIKKLNQRLVKIYESLLTDNMNVLEEHNS
ncbi:MAG: glycosyltransferase [Candidatus Methylarchaceae archaeon HK01M]|nr:glycosyltransferase [Candidatus Methylarchaceae archaeon HK01M]